jgi:hypothetical protein
MINKTIIWQKKDYQDYYITKKERLSRQYN